MRASFPLPFFFSVQRWSRISQAHRLCTGTQSNDGLGFAALSHISHRLLCQPKDRFGQDMTIKKSEAFKSINLSVISLSKFWLKFSWKIYKVFTLLMLHLWQNKSGIFHVQLNQEKKANDLYVPVKGKSWLVVTCNSEISLVGTSLIFVSIALCTTRAGQHQVLRCLLSLLCCSQSHCDAHNFPPLLYCTCSVGYLQEQLIYLTLRGTVAVILLGMWVGVWQYVTTNTSLTQK